MKRLSLKIALIAVMCTASLTMYAQNGGDTIKSDFPDHSEIKGYETLDLPVFTGAEQDLQDSLQSVGAALTDTALRNTVLKGVAVIKDVPKDGKAESWISWAFGAVAALFGVYAYIRKNFYKVTAEAERSKKQFAENKVNVLLPALKLSAELLESKKLLDKSEQRASAAKKATPERIKELKELAKQENNPEE